MADSPKKEESSKKGDSPKKATTPQNDTTSAPAAPNTLTRPSGIPPADPSSDRRMVNVPDKDDDDDAHQHQQPSAPSTEMDEGGASTEQQQGPDQGAVDNPSPPGSSKALSRSQKKKEKKKLKRKEKEAAAAASSEGGEETKANLPVTPENKRPETPVDSSRSKEKAGGGEVPQLTMLKIRLVRKDKQAAAAANPEGGEKADPNLLVTPDKELPKTPVDSAKGIEKAGGGEDAKANLFVTPENKRPETPVDSLKGKEKAAESKLGDSPWHASGGRSLEDEGVYEYLGDGAGTTEKQAFATPTKFTTPAKLGSPIKFTTPIRLAKQEIRGAFNKLTGKVDDNDKTPVPTPVPAPKSASSTGNQTNPVADFNTVRQSPSSLSRGGGGPGRLFGPPRPPPPAEASIPVSAPPPPSGPSIPAPSPPPSGGRVWDAKNLEVKRLILEALAGRGNRSEEELQRWKDGSTDILSRATMANNPEGLPVFPKYDEQSDAWEQAKIRGEEMRKKYLKHKAEHPEEDEHWDRVAENVFGKLAEGEKEPVDESDREEDPEEGADEGAKEGAEEGLEEGPEEVPEEGPEEGPEEDPEEEPTQREGFGAGGEWVPPAAPEDWPELAAQLDKWMGQVSPMAEDLDIGSPDSGGKGPATAKSEELVVGSPDSGGKGPAPAKSEDWAGPPPAKPEDWPEAQFEEWAASPKTAGKTGDGGEWPVPDEPEDRAGSSPNLKAALERIKELEKDAMDPKTREGLAMSAAMSLVAAEKAEAKAKELEGRTRFVEETLVNYMATFRSGMDGLRDEMADVKVAVEGGGFSGQSLIGLFFKAALFILVPLLVVLALGHEALDRNKLFLGRYGGIYVNGGFKGFQSYASFDKDAKFVWYTLASAVFGGGVRWLFEGLLRV